MSSANQSARARFTERMIHGPEGFRRLLERLGPTYIKMGQFLAMRPDLVPQEYCDELMRLFDRVPPFPWFEAKAILERELGHEVSEIFAHINVTPVAAGSLAQTHSARLLDGTHVAVKIQRPNIVESVRRDIRRARLLVRLLEVSGASFIISPRDTLEEVSGWLMQEIDFTHELANMTRLHYLTAGDRNSRVPRPYPQFSTAKVLTAEYLWGVPFSDLLATLRSDPIEGHDRLLKKGISTEKLAASLLFACLTQIFRYEFFHADLHPGNLIALPGNLIGFVDFGLCDELDPIVREGQMRYLSAVYTENAELMYRALIEILIPGEQTDLESFRRDFLNETRSWRRRETANATRPGGSKERSPTQQWMIAVMRAARRNGLQVPSKVLSIYRALLTAESVAYELGTGIDLQWVGKSFFESLQRDEILRALDIDALRGYLLSVFNLVRNSPAQLDQLLSELSEGRFSLNTVNTESARTARLNNRRTRILVNAIVSVGLALILAKQSLPTVAGINITWPLAILLLALYLVILFQFRRLR